MRVDLTRRSLKCAADRLAIEQPLTQPGFFFDASAVAAPSIKRQEDQPTLWADKPVPEITPEESASPSGLKSKAKATLNALRLLKQLEAENRLPDPGERRILAGFSGFGMLANHIFPEPGTERYKAGWEELGNSLAALLSPDEYESAKRSTYNAFYTAPQIMQAVYQAIARMGVPASGIQALEPGCGIGNFISAAPQGMAFIAVEKEVLSGRIARLLHPDHDIRIEPFQKTALPTGSIDLVVGNVPFSDLSLKWQESKLALHDYFFAKSLESLHAGGVLALVTSRYTLDKQDSGFRETLAASADFLGAIRLPKGAFRQEGTEVVTDIVFLRKRGKEQTPNHAGDWLQTAPLPSGTAHCNGYFLAHPEMVVGELDEDQGMYGNHELTVRFPADFTERLANAVAQLPANVFTPSLAPAKNSGVSTRQTAHSSALLSSHRRLPGSLFIQPDGQIMSVTDTAGNAEPLTYGNTPVSSLSGTVGTRLAGLIAIRDAARHVLDTQREGKSEAERSDARVLLNRRYDAFVRKWGAINKTTISYLKDGTPVRRQPNLTGFKDDPDVYLLMALEQYDEKTDSARKMPMLERDVIGSTPPVEQVTSALDGLLVSLNQTGKVDLRLIASLYGASEETVITELGSHIFYDPAQNCTVTAEEYLSGNVREKLRIANEGAADPRIALGIQPLSEAQPDPVPPGDIDVTLGASWVPEEMVQGFVAQLLDCPLEQVTVRHVGREALWQVTVPEWINLKAESISTYGTAERPAITLINDALNMGVPTVMQTIRTSDGERQVIDPEATLAAREKQKAIKSAFQSWLFADPARADTLTERYNRLFNTTRLRHFDGSHLTFPGMNPEIMLRPHQQDAIWRVMSSRNSLLAHAVGAGKTYEMIAAGIKMKQTGLIRKPLFVVPNHMLEQFSREFYILYPNAKLLVASKEDLAKEKRRLLTAKAASGEWDGIIMTHSSFEKIGMSPDFQADFVREQIDDYENLLLDMKAGSDSEGKRLIKRIEKQKESWEQRLEELMAQDRKDVGLTFEELGVDHLFMDEAHLFKNLETPTKMQVAGVQSSGSLRAFDLFIKARYLDGHGHGTTFATGTPISNSMVEMYTMSRFLAPELLHERGIDHFDGWAAVFGDIVDTIELSPDAQSLRQNRRFARFVNLPELLQIFHSFADVKTTDMLHLPQPRLKGDKPTIIATPMNPHQKKIQETLVSRYERVRGGSVNPKDDNALNITTDGRKLALDARLVYPHLPESPGKIDALVENVHAIWQRTQDSKATQMIFCDLGVGSKDGQFSVYAAIIKRLIAAGIPANQIANIGDYDTDIKKARLFAQLRGGDIRVVLGSTQKMGTGTNVQQRLYALHHLDAPWKPAEVEQREGRILRQGNSHDEVEIFRYVTAGSFDAYMWQTLQTKAEFINQVMKGDLSIRRIEDMDEQTLSYAEVKAIASGNPAVLTLAKIDMEVQKLTQLSRAHRNEQYRIRQTIRQMEDADLPFLIHRQGHIAQDIATIAENGGSASPTIVIDNQPVSDPKAAQEHLRETVEHQWEMLAFMLEAAPIGTKERAMIGTFGGLEIQLTLEKAEFLRGTLSLVGNYRISRPLRGAGSDRLLAYLHELIAGLPGIADEAKQEQIALETRLDGLQTRLGLPFEHEDRLSQLSAMRGELQMLLQGDAPARPTHDNAAESENTVTPATPAPEVIKQRIQTLVTTFDALMKEGFPAVTKSPADSKAATDQPPSIHTPPRSWSESVRLAQNQALHQPLAAPL